MAKAMDIIPSQKEKILASPRRKKFNSLNKVTRKTYVMSVVVGLLIILTVSVLAATRTSNKLPKYLEKSAGFSIYYPSVLLADYNLDKKSVTYENQIIFFSFSNGSKKISVSEQAAPKNPPDFSLIQKSNTSFKKLDVTGGQAIYGVSQNVPAALLLTNTTMINISASNNVPLDNVAAFAQNMKPD
jgi:hypothetical protein